MLRQFLAFFFSILILCLFVQPAPSFAQSSFALSFDGLDDLARIEDDSLLSGGPGKSLTVEAWVKLSQVDGNHPIIEKFLDANWKDWGIMIDAGKLTVGIETDGDNWEYQAGSVSANVWTYLAFAFDNAADTVRLFINGVEVGSASQTKDMPDTEAPILLAKRAYTDTYTAGSVDEVRIWNYARSSSQLQAEMNRVLQGNEPGLIGYWRFDEGDGQISADWTGNNNPIRLGASDESDAGDPTWVVSDAPLTGQPFVLVVSPNGGEHLLVGEDFKIKWSASSSIAKVAIAFSPDSGFTWITIVKGVTNDGRYVWTVPDMRSPNCLIRIADATDDDPFDVSDGTFSIGSALFTDVTAIAGIGVDSSGTHGVAVADVNGDDYPDIFINSQEDNKIPANQYKGNYLFLNNADGTFQRFDAQAGVQDEASYAHAGIFFDMDHDGDYDLAIGHGLDGLSRRGLFQNNGDGTFVQVDAISGFEESGDIGTRSIVVGDMNGDGLLDIHFASFDGYDTEGYFGEGNGRFSRMYGLNDRDRAIQGMTMADMDGDGDLDVLMGSLTSTDGIAYYQNDGTGQFTRIFGAGLPETGSASTANVADVNRDGALDVFITPEQMSQSELYLSTANGYVLSQNFPTIPDANCFGGCGNSNGVFGDFDNDGDWDLLLPAGVKKIWLNDGNGVFTGLPDEESGVLFEVRDARFPALLDYDRDGDLDVVITQHDGSAHLFRNNTNNQQWVRVEAKGPLSDRGGFGTKVWLYENGYMGDPAHLIAYSEAMASAGYCIQNEPILHFGLGHRAVADLRAQLIDGTVLDFPNLTAGQSLQIFVNRIDTLRVLEGSGERGSSGNSVFVELVNTSSITGLQFELTDTPDFLTMTAVKTTNRTQGFSISMDVSGSIQLSSSTGATIAPGSGPVIEVLYDVSSTAYVSEIVLQLLNVTILDGNGQQIQSPVLVGNVFRVQLSVGVESSSLNPPQFYSLEKNYPNPFRATTVNAETGIAYQLPQRSHVKLAVYDLLGRELKILVNQAQEPGTYQVWWDGRDHRGGLLPSGIYIYRLEAGNFHRSQRLLMIK
jgi:hypothetical protein